MSFMEPPIGILADTERFCVTGTSIPKAILEPIGLMTIAFSCVDTEMDWLIHAFIGDHKKAALELQTNKFFGRKYDLLKDARKNIKLNTAGNAAIQSIFRDLKTLNDQRIRIVHENIAGFMWGVDGDRCLTDAKVRFMPKNLMLLPPGTDRPSTDMNIEELMKLANLLIVLCRKIETFRLNYLSKTFSS